MSRILPWLLCLFLAACAASVRPLRPADLVLTAPAGPAAQAAEAVAAVYAEERGLVIRVEALRAQDYDSQVAAALLAGLDRYDLALVPSSAVPKWASYHVIRPLDTGGNLIPWQPLVTSGGQLYGVPVQPDIEVLWYRQDWLDEAGLAPPATWPAFRAAALALNQPPGRYGAAVAGGETDAGLDLAALLPGFDDSPGQSRDISRQSLLDALSFYAALRSVDGVVSPEAGRWTRSDVVKALAAGQAAMGIAPLSAGETLLDCAETPAACVEGLPLLAWSTLPGLEAGEAIGEVSAWVIPQHAAHAAAAQEMAAWLAGPEGARAWADAGGLPSSPPVLRGLPAASGGPALAAIESFFRPFPVVRTIEGAAPTYHQAAHAAISGAQTPDQALETAWRALQAALDRGLYP